MSDDEAGQTEELGPPAWTGDHDVLTGSCSWTDRTLVEEGDWYPRKTMSAEERLRYYAAQFPLTEIDSTYYAPPAERQVGLWAARTPDGFRFDVKAYSLLTGHPTKPGSLWRDLRDDLPPDVAEKRKHLRQAPGYRGDGRGVEAVRVRAPATSRGGEAGCGPVPVPALVRPPEGQPGGNRVAARAAAGLPDQRRVPLAPVAARRARPRAHARDARGAGPRSSCASTRPRCPNCRASWR